MRKAKRWRYYCDFCKKSGGSKWHMEKHEKSCTMNPDRTCGFCEFNGDHPTKKHKEKLKSIVKKAVGEFWDEAEIGIDEHPIDYHERITEQLEKDLLKEASGCPACVLAAIRQVKDAEFIQFDYKKAKDQFWEDHPRDEELERYP